MTEEYYSVSRSALSEMMNKGVCSISYDNKGNIENIRVINDNVMHTLPVEYLGVKNVLPGDVQVYVLYKEGYDSDITYSGMIFQDKELAEVYAKRHGYKVRTDKLITKLDKDDIAWYLEQLKFRRITNQNSIELIESQIKKFSGMLT